MLTGIWEGRWRSWWRRRRQPGWREWRRPETPGPACWHTWHRQTPPWPWRSTGWSHTRACCSAGQPLPRHPPGPPGERWLLWALCRSEREGVKLLCVVFCFWPIYPGKAQQNFSHKSSIHAYCSPRASWRYLFRECYSSTFLTHLPSLSGDLNWQISGHKPPPPALLLLLLNSINSPWAKRKKKGWKTIKEGEKSMRWVQRTTLWCVKTWDAQISSSLAVSGSSTQNSATFTQLD